jgi:chaperonin GroES
VSDVAPIRKPKPAELRQSVRMTADRVLVRAESDEDRRSRGGLLIPPTAAPDQRRGVWSEVVAIGPLVRTISVGDHVLHLPDAGFEAEIRGEDYLLLRERDLHAIASDGDEGSGTGLYL